MRRLGFVLSSTMLVLAGCLEDSGSSDEADATDADTGEPRGPDRPPQRPPPGNNPPSQPPSDPPPEPDPTPPNDTHIRVTEEILLESLDTTYAWDVAKGARHLRISVWVHDYNDTGVQVGQIDMNLTTPTTEESDRFGSVIGTTTQVGANNVGGPQMVRDWSGDIDADLIGHWTLRLATTSDPPVPAIGGWTVSVDVEY